MLSAVLAPLSFTASMAPVVQTVRSSSSLRMGVETMCAGMMAAGATQLHTSMQAQLGGAAAGLMAWLHALLWRCVRRICLYSRANAIRAQAA